MDAHKRFKKNLNASLYKPSEHLPSGGKLCKKGSGGNIGCLKKNRCVVVGAAAFFIFFFMIYKDFLHHRKHHIGGIRS